MPFLYSQSTGLLTFPDGVQTAQCYSGIGEGFDNPADQAVPNMGPIPVGAYIIGPAFDHPQCGPLTMRLTPTLDTDTFGRSGFCIHGDNKSMNHTASHGCVIAPHYPRAMVAQAQAQAAPGDLLLKVVP